MTIIYTEVPEGKEDYSYTPRLISQQRIDTSLTNKNNERFLQMTNIITVVPAFNGNEDKFERELRHYNEVECLTKQHELLGRLDKLNWADMPLEERNAKLESDKHQLYLDGFFKDSKDKYGHTVRIFTADFLALYETYIVTLES